MSASGKRFILNSLPDRDDSGDDDSPTSRDKKYEIKGNPAVNLYRHPERLADRMALSLSLIDERHNKTFGDFGIIVGAPNETVVSANPRDSATRNDNARHLHNLSGKPLQFTGTQVLKRTLPEFHNEIVAIARKNDQQIKLDGFFYQSDAIGKPINSRAKEILNRHAERLHLPIIPIYNPYAFQRPTDSWRPMFGDGYEVSLNGQSYRLGVGGVQRFSVMKDGKLREGFMSRTELVAACDFLRRCGIQESEILKIDQSFEEGRRAYQLPTLEFDDERNVRRLQKRLGCEENHDLIVIESDGVAYRVKIRQLAEYNGDLLLEDRCPSSRPFRPLSLVNGDRAIVDKMFADAIALSDVWHRAIVKNWVSEISDEVGGRGHTPSFDQSMYYIMEANAPLA
jgi:hypothetical protein